MRLTEPAPTGSCTASCYAIRRVNPYLGVLQIIETDDGRATTSNGMMWLIEIIADQPAGWGSLNQQGKAQAFYHYGLWSESDGFVRQPTAPSPESQEQIMKRDCLIAEIIKNCSQLPFSLKDTKELWLFDEQGTEPLALIASCTSYQMVSTPEPKTWSACIGLHGTQGQRPYAHAAAVEQIVKKRAGFNIQRKWVERESTGDGRTRNGDEVIAAERFPSFLVRQEWESEEHTNLMMRYIGWIAPELLTLQNINDTERDFLENHLKDHATSVKFHWRLFPKVLNQTLLKAARVQGRLQEAE